MSDASPVSVVVIFRDAARFLRDAFASLEAQTLARFEVLLVDDGSSDGSAALAEAQRAARPERYRCLTHPGGARRGTAASRNLGMRAARGTLVAFLDADDLYLPTRLASHAALLAAHPDAGLVLAPCLFTDIDAGGAPLHEHQQPALPWPDGSVVDPPQALFAMLRDPRLVTTICGLTVRRDALLRSGGCDEGFDLLYEDQTLLTRLLLGERALWCATPSVQVRRFPGIGTRTHQRLAFLPWGRWQRDSRRFRAWQADRLGAWPSMRPRTDAFAVAVEGAALALRYALRVTLRVLLDPPRYSSAMSLLQRLRTPTSARPR